MDQSLRFDDKVVIITGAGGGLGREYAKMYGARGARVVVNDLGGSPTGEGEGSSRAADLVVNEIIEADGEAVANYDSVTDGDAIVQTALDAYGTVDIVVNNAGILRDTTFHKMSQADWRSIMDVHLNGSMSVTRAAWPILREKGFGRIIMTASAAGIYGNFGQANYSTAKLGLHGLAQTLSLEGAPKGVFVNTIAPLAASRLTETVLPEAVLKQLSPAHVAPLVGWLTHADCNETGGLFEVGAGVITRLRWESSEGARFRVDRRINIEDVAGRFDRINDFERSFYPKAPTDTLALVLDNVNNPRHGGNRFIDLDLAEASPPLALENSYDERDVALYALGVGVGKNPLAEDTLRYVFERGEAFSVLPSYGVMPPLNSLLSAMMNGEQAPGLNVGFDRLLHGEQYTELKYPIAPKARLRHEARLARAFDKGEHAVGVVAIDSFDEEGRKVLYNESTFFMRGAGGWGGDRGSSTPENGKPDRAPDAVVEETIADDQALLYRLSGDWNPLHVDPAFAKNFGFNRPILHGLCTFGYVARQAVETFLGAEPGRFKSIKVRFVQSVYPGETLVTSFWKDGDNRVIFETRVKDRDEVVISNAAVEFYDATPEKPAVKAATASESAGNSERADAPAQEVVSADVFNAITALFEKDPAAATAPGSVFQFDLSNPDHQWTLDMKDGAVVPGPAAKPDCTLIMSDADFLAMMLEGQDPQQLYFAGKLKITGNVMASAKLEVLKTLDPALVSEAAAARLSGGAPIISNEAAPADAGTSGASDAADVISALENEVPRHAETFEPVSGKTIGLRLKQGEPRWLLSADATNASLTPDESGDLPRTATVIIDDERVDAVLRSNDPLQSLYQHGAFYVHGDLKAGVDAIDALRALSRITA